MEAVLLRELRRWRGWRGLEYFSRPGGSSMAGAWKGCREGLGSLEFGCVGGQLGGGVVAAESMRLGLLRSHLFGCLRPHRSVAFKLESCRSQVKEVGLCYAVSPHELGRSEFIHSTFFATFACLLQDAGRLPVCLTTSFVELRMHFCRNACLL